MMFVRKKDYLSTVKYFESRCDQLNERYWTLWRAHGLLLDHLGLLEVDIREHTELRRKGGPEESERNE